MYKPEYDSYYSILRHELVKAQGCTEPIAIAFAAAKARALLGVAPERIELSCSGNMVKNAMGVVVPNSGGARGIDVAAILGALGGEDGLELEVLSHVTEADIAQMQVLRTGSFCKCILCEDEEPLFIQVKAFSGEHWTQVTIRHTHTNITELIRDGVSVFAEQENENRSAPPPSKEILSFKNILDFAKNADVNTLKEILHPQIELNCNIAKEGLTHAYGAQVGQTVLDCQDDCVRTRACAKAAAGSDARMGGCLLPVVINSGSGNQGITVSVPVVEYASHLQAPEEKLYRALAISNPMAIHLQRYIGSLSAFCGAVSAACGSGAAIAYLLGGDDSTIARTVTNTLGNVSGIICDGAKSSCAAKIYSAVNAAVLAAEMSIHGRAFCPGEGIVTDDIETTIRSIGHVGKVGMRSTDSVVLNLMLSHGNI